jgi:hypothetical protein
MQNEGKRKGPSAPAPLSGEPVETGAEQAYLLKTTLYYQNTKSRRENCQKLWFGSGFD